VNNLQKHVGALRMVYFSVIFLTDKEERVSERNEIKKENYNFKSKYEISRSNPVKNLCLVTVNAPVGLSQQEYTALPRAKGSRRTAHGSRLLCLSL
jgi:hypothetical protein